MSLEAHLAKGKVTIFDFYAVWCGPCRMIDAHIFPKLGRDKDIAVRNLNVVDWESPITAHFLKDESNLPFLVIFGRKDRKVATISGFDVAGIDEAIAKGQQQ